MAEKEKSIIINAPVDEVYGLWAHFPNFPKFMTHVKDVTLKSPTESHWKVELAGIPLEFDAEVTELVDNKRIAWNSISGIKNSGFVEFEKVPEGTKVTVHINYMPETYPQEFADKLGAGRMVEDQIQEDLNNLKSRIEGMAKAA